MVSEAAGMRAPSKVPTATRRGRGSGIGLYAARRLMEAMGGRIWIEGNGFGGSRFVVALPAVAPA